MGEGKVLTGGSPYFRGSSQILGCNVSNTIDAISLVELAKEFW